MNIGVKPIPWITCDTANTPTHFWESLSQGGGPSGPDPPHVSVGPDDPDEPENFQIKFKNVELKLKNR